MRENLSWSLGLILCILVLLMINVVMTMKLSMNIQKSQPGSVQREPLSCEAIPVRFVIEEPECTNRLLRSMNITNVSILPAAASNSVWDDESLARYLRKAMSHKFFEEIRAIESTEGQEATGAHQSYSGKNQT